jgi:hypothetical protein
MTVDLHDPTTLLNTAIIPVGATAISLLLLRRALKGRRVDDHPVCAKCRYDLFGLSAPATCPECGADLARPRAIDIGRRTPRPLVVYTALATLLLSLAALAFWTRTTYQVFSLDTNKPTWWLMHRIDDRNSPIRDAAVTELRRRLQFAKLAPAQIDKIADRALTLQADDKTPWQPIWGAFLESARDTNKLDEARWQRYLRQAIPLAVADHRKVVRRGDPIPFRVRQGPARTSTDARFFLQYATRVEINGQAVHMPPSDSAMILVIGPQWPTPTTPNPHREYAIPFRGPVLQNLVDGVQKMSIEFQVSVHSNRKDQAGNALGKFTIREDCHWSLVAPDTPTVEVFDDPALADDIGKKLRVISARRTRAIISFGVVATGITTPLAAKVFLRHNGSTFPGGHVILRPPNDTAAALAFNLSDAAMDKVDVILRASPEVAAANTPDLARIPAGEWTFHDILVRSDSSFPPSSTIPAPPRRPPISR